MAGGARSRSPLLWAGLVLIVVGVSLLGYIGWQFYGTNWVSDRRQAAINEQLRTGWERGQSSVTVDQGTATAIIRIPAFGDDYAVPVLNGTSDDVLASGLGHFTGTAGPGEAGNYAIAGHRVTHGQPLRDMPDLDVGDLILVDTAQTTYTYQLVTAGDALTVPFTADWVLNPLPTNPDPDGVEPPQEPGSRLLTLTTCSELFHTDNRLVAFAELVGTAARP